MITYLFYINDKKLNKIPNISFLYKRKYNYMEDIMEYEYECIDGEYFLHHGEGCTPIGKEVSICFDYTSDGCAVLLKHGRQDIVESCYNNMIEVYKKHNMHNLVETIYMITDKIPVGELNKIISISDYVGKYYQSLWGEKDETEWND